MNQITPEQSKALKTWSERRDEILGEISTLTTEANEINRTNAEGHSAFSELQGRINQAIGRLDELDRIEQQNKETLSKEVADLKVEKATLQGQVATAKVEYESVESKKKEVFDLLSSFGSIFSTILDNANVLNGTVGEIQEKARVHGTDLNALLTDVKKSTGEVVAINEENVKITKIVLEKVPRLVFEMSKPLPVRRVPGK